jgi:hypothetical protein
LDKISHLQRVLKDFTIISAIYIKILIFGLSWFWFSSVEKVFTNMKLHQRKWKMKKQIKANLDQKLKFSYKERKRWWNLWGLLGGLKSYQIGLVQFLQFSKSLKAGPNKNQTFETPQSHTSKPLHIFLKAAVKHVVIMWEKSETVGRRP